MNIKLENIGIIKDSTLILDGLTVITGQNNSGKTTVGKVIYSLIDAVCNLQQKAKNDRSNYIRKQLNEVKSSLDIFRFWGTQNLEGERDVFTDSPFLIKFLNRKYYHDFDNSSIEDFARSLKRELELFDISLIDKDSYNLENYSKYIRYNNDSTIMIEMFDAQVKDAIEILQQMLIDIDKDVELIDYSRESINQTLNVEFSSQIQPVKQTVEKSHIELTEGDSIFFKLDIKNNTVVNNGNPVFLRSPYKKIYLIDSPFILDEIQPRRSFPERNVGQCESILNTQRIITHENKLKFVLKSKKGPSLFEKTVLESSYEDLKKKIDEIIPGTFEFDSDGEFYINGGKKLKVSNLAAGAKIFSIIKILIEKGEIDSSTMLILDEPEAHLHPMWQNRFAEIITLLVKFLRVNILLTTHSSNFMLAIDAYMRKYDLSEKTNFYQTEVLEDGFVRYQSVNDDMGKIYSDFLQYLSEMKMLRNMYLDNNEGVL